MQAVFGLVVTVRSGGITVELKELTEKTLDLLEIESTDEMSKRLFDVVRNNNVHIYEKFCKFVENDLVATKNNSIFVT